MRVLECVQGSEEWVQARLGIPTASCFDKILTPTGKPSTQADAYACQLLAEELTGRPQGWTGNSWTDRGTELEPEARELYELVTGRTVQQVGFCTRDGFGCSPDGLIGEDGLLELKCPAAHTHVKYLLGGKVPTDYVPQTQGALLITNRAWLDFVSYFPGMPPLLVRAEPMPEYQALLLDALTRFAVLLDKRRAELRARL